MSSEDLIKEKERVNLVPRDSASASNVDAWPVPALAAPELDPRYEVLSVLGQGGMGTVYKVFDKSLGKTFAIKVLRKELAEDAQAVRRFEQEIKAATELTHENLVSVYGHGKSGDDLPYLIMDFVEGESLADVLRNEGKVSSEKAVSIFMQTCQALEHAHKRNVIHRDLKPSNIMLKKSSSGAADVRVLDFGIAKILASEGSDFSKTNLTQTGDIFGSPLYMSPEQCENNPQDARSDIYSLGCVMYESLTGVQPFYAENPVKVILKHINLDPEPMSSTANGKGISKDFDCVVQKCLQRNPKDRYQTVQELLQDLCAISSGKPVSAKPRPRKKARQPLTFKKKMVIATVASVVTGVSLAGITEGWKLYNILNPTLGPDDYTNAQKLDTASYSYFIKGEYEKSAPLLEFGIAAYRERIEQDRKSNNEPQLRRDETLLTENIQHVGKCYLEIAKKAEKAGDQKKALQYFEKARDRYEEAMTFWRRWRFSQLGGTMASEAVGEYAEVLQKLGHTKELERLNGWRVN